MSPPAPAAPTTGGIAASILRNAGVESVASSAFAPAPFPRPERRGDPNVISWGAMVAIGRPLLRSATYLSVIPGMAILLTVLSINLFGEALNEALSGRKRH